MPLKIETSKLSAPALKFEEWNFYKNKPRDECREAEVHVLSVAVAMIDCYSQTPTKA